MGPSVLWQLKESYKGSPGEQIETMLGPPDYRIPQDLRELESDNEATGAKLDPGDLAIGYCLMNDPPFPNSYTENLWIEFNSHGRLVDAWIDDGLYP